MEWVLVEAILITWVAGCIAFLPPVRRLLQSVGDWLAGARIERSEVGTLTVLCLGTLAITVLVGLTWPI